jgi:hypothetical protein
MALDQKVVKGSGYMIWEEKGLAESSLKSGIPSLTTASAEATYILRCGT